MPQMIGYAAFGARKKKKPVDIERFIADSERIQDGQEMEESERPADPPEPERSEDSPDPFMAEQASRRLAEGKPSEAKEEFGKRWEGADSGLRSMEVGREFDAWLQKNDLDLEKFEALEADELRRLVEQELKR